MIRYFCGGKIRLISALNIIDLYFICLQLLYSFDIRKDTASSIAFPYLVDSVLSGDTLTFLLQHIILTEDEKSNSVLTVCQVERHEGKRIS